MKKLFFLLLLASSQLVQAQMDIRLLNKLGGTSLVNADLFDVNLMASNKESYSRQLTGEDYEKLKHWSVLNSVGYANLKVKAARALKVAMVAYIKREAKCSLGLPTLLAQSAVEVGAIDNKEDFRVFLAFLRKSQLIDDLFYKMVKDSDSVNREMKTTSKNDLPRRPFNLHTSENENVDLAKVYSITKKWPNEVEACSFGLYSKLTKKIKWSSTKDRDSQMRKLNYLAAKQKIISYSVFHKLEVLRRKKVLDWHVYPNEYIDILTNAKDKSAKTLETVSTNHYTETYVSRKERLTRRGRLYKVFSSTQIMMLSQVIERTAKRMDSRYVGLNFQYTDDPKVEGEIYVLSPMEQYRVAIKMLRKDLGELMRSESFKGTGIEFEDLISSSFETGLIKSDELDHIVKFEEFWNPKKPKWKTYVNFAFSLGGSATFFLPAPFNLVGALALVITQSKIMKDKTVDSDDNWNAIL